MYRVFYKLHRTMRTVVAYGNIDLAGLLDCILSLGGRIDHVEEIYN